MLSHLMDITLIVVTVFPPSHSSTHSNTIQNNNERNVLAFYFPLSFILKKKNSFVFSFFVHLIISLCIFTKTNWKSKYSHDIGNIVMRRSVSIERKNWDSCIFLEKTKWKEEEAMHNKLINFYYYSVNRFHHLSLIIWRLWKWIFSRYYAEDQFLFVRYTLVVVCLF